MKTKQIITQILTNYGITLNKKGEEVRLKSGWQVGTECFYSYDISKNPEEELKKCLRNIKTRLSQLKSNEYLGFWIDNGVIYVDKSVRISTKAKALSVGTYFRQLSIYNWKNQKCVSCG